MSWGLCILLLLASISSIQEIPWGPFLGLDLQNLYAFHHCTISNNPYALTGIQCGDVLGRPMIYPPLLYWSFIWLRPIEMAMAAWIWSSAAILIMGRALYFWAEPAARRNWQYVSLAVLFMFQFPMTFAVERGNNDVLIVALWTLSLLAAQNHRWKNAGFLVGLAASAKIYPTLPALMILGGGFCSSLSLISMTKFLVGLVSAVGLCALLFFDSTQDYLFAVAPDWSKLMLAIPGVTHSVSGFFEEWPWARYGILSILGLAWCLAAKKYLKRDPAFVFAGTLATSTYFAGVSFDYNLVTVYPLLALLASRVVVNSSPLAWGSVGLGFIAFFGNRTWWLNSGLADATRLQVILQVSWLVWVSRFPNQKMKFSKSNLTNASPLPPTDDLKP